MKKIINILLIFLATSVYSQTRVAILDFENTSGITKYDGFGKAMSNMLITDLKNSIHPRKVTFLERSQLNKILDEQGLQKSKNFDDNTAVNFGKLAGVKYILVGSVYVLDGICNINSRLVDVETSEIIHAKESNGQIVNWLNLKTVLAEELSGALNNPIKIEDEYSSGQVSESLITQYSKLIEKMDEGNVEGAQNMIEILSELQPDFKYFTELKNDIEFLKQEIEKLNEKVDIAIEDPYGLALEAMNRSKYEKAKELLKIAEKQLYENDEMINNKKLFIYTKLGVCNYRLQEYNEAIKNFSDAEKLFPWQQEANLFKILTLVRLNRQDEAKALYIESTSNINYYFQDNFKEKYSKVNFSSSNNLDDGYGELNNGTVGSSGEFTSLLIGFIKEEGIELNFNASELEYSNFVNKLSSFNEVSLQEMLNFYYERSGRFFSTVNECVWDLMTSGDYKSAQKILEENLLLLYNLKRPKNPEDHELYREAREKYQVDLFGDYSDEDALESGVLLLGNLLTCYAVNGQIEKARLIYCDFFNGEARFYKNNPESIYLISAVLPQVKKSFNHSENLHAIMMQDVKDLKLDNSIFKEITNCNCNHYTYQRDWFMLYENGINFQINNGEKFLEKSDSYFNLLLKNKDVIQTSTGLCYEVLKEGSGKKITTGQIVKMEIIHTLNNGRYIWKGHLQPEDKESEHYDHKYSLTYTLGSENIPNELYFENEFVMTEGINEALRLMKKGSRYKIYLPPKLGLNDYANFDYPPYSIHIYEIEVLNVE